MNVTVIDLEFSQINDFDLIKMVYNVHKYMNKDNNRKYSINLVNNALSDEKLENMEIIRDFSLMDERIVYVNLSNNYILGNNESKYLIKTLEDKYLKKLILLFPGYMEKDRLSCWKLTDKQLDLMLYHNEKYYKNCFDEANDVKSIYYKNYDIKEKLRKYNYAIYYCKHCYFADIDKNNCNIHMYLCDQHKERCIERVCTRYCSIEKITEKNNSYDKTVLNKIIEENDIDKLHGVSKYPRYTYQKLSKKVYKELSKRWIVDNRIIKNLVSIT